MSSYGLEIFSEKGRPQVLMDRRYAKLMTVFQVNFVFSNTGSTNNQVTIPVPGYDPNSGDWYIKVIVYVLGSPYGYYKILQRNMGSVLLQYNSYDTTDYGSLVYGTEQYIRLQFWKF